MADALADQVDIALLELIPGIVAEEGALAGDHIGDLVTELDMLQNLPVRIQCILADLPDIDEIEWLCLLVIGIVKPKNKTFLIGRPHSHSPLSRFFYSVRIFP